MAETDPKQPEADAPKPEAPETGVQTTLTRQGPCECSITIEADEDHLKGLYEQKLDLQHKEAVLPGFRAGKAPRGLIARRYADQIKKSTLASVVEEAYEQAVKDNELTVVAEVEAPDIDEMDWEVGQPARFEFKCEVLPEVELNPEQYKGLKVQVPRLAATEEARQQELERFARRLASWDPVREGTIDWEDAVEAEVTARAPDQEAELWKGAIGFRPREEAIGPFEVSGIKAAIMDAKPGDTLELDGQVQEEEANEPDEALKALAGQTVKLEVEILNVYRLHVPEINDELAVKLGMENADEIRSMVGERLEKQLEAQSEQARRHAVVEAIVDLVDLEMPASLVESASRDEQRRQTIRALRMGSTAQQAEEMAQKAAGQSRDIALRRLKGTFLLKIIADKERIYILDSEVQEQARAMAASEGWAKRRTERFLEDDDLLRTLTEEMREEKTAKFLIESAEVEEIDPEEFSRRMRARHQDSETPQAEP